MNQATTEASLSASTHQAASQPEVAEGVDQATRAVPRLSNHEAITASCTEESRVETETETMPPVDLVDEDEASVAQPISRCSSPGSVNDVPHPPADDAGHIGTGYAQAFFSHKMHKFSLYETASRYYVVGVDVSERRYRILKIDRSTEGLELNMTDDKITYSLQEVNQLLDTIDDGNRGTGGIKLRCTTWGIIGFIRFTGPYYMLLITKKSTVAMVGGHYIYQIEGTELVPLIPGKAKPGSRNTDEQRFLGILNNMDLTKSFYYSYSYDITRTLQHNIIRERETLDKGLLPSPDDDLNTMFIWNSYLLDPAIKGVRTAYDWCRPIIHGYVDQAALSIYGRTAHITVIARRSRHFAGARFLKRGANDMGHVANDVETEQIVSESLTTSFHSPGPRLFCNPQYTSYVQHRGSIPLYWSQDSTGVTPKPPIELNLVDPFYGAASMHFDNLFERYGAPIYVLNLIKSKERQPRESKLLQEYTHAIAYMNQFLPPGKKIIHKAWDMSRASKVRGGDVIGNLEVIAESVVTTTGFFQNGDGRTSQMQVQNGVGRTNCIDCLDRTNAAQFVIGKKALGYQLHALGILDNTSVDYDTDAVNLFTHMWHDHGDTIAVQYGGSQLVNTMETYRKINQWTSHSRDMIESFKRYYNNSFLDSQRQEAYNLFLGNYVFQQNQPLLWDLSTDYYLHHIHPRDWSITNSKSYTEWYNPSHIRPRTTPASLVIKGARGKLSVEAVDDYWLEYYRPSTLSSFPKMFAYKMNSTIKYIPLRATQDGRYDLSPFRVRTDLDTDSDRRSRKADLAAETKSTLSPGHATEDGVMSATSSGTATKGISLHRWLQPVPEKCTELHCVSNADPVFSGRRHEMEDFKPTALEKSNAAQWTFTKAVHDSLNPSLQAQEEDDYDRYIRHPQNLPLVISNHEPSDVDASEYRDYINGSWKDQGLSFTDTDEEVDLYHQLLRIGDNPLTVTDDDATKKRYKAYRKWLRGKCFFKQQPLD
ncbi:hypothetical protein E4U41_007732 [Claviceps citrina]|nr:hypothetical protein E4U41_007732 [Claviceps citrina]